MCTLLLVKNELVWGWKIALFRLQTRTHHHLPLLLILILPLFFFFFRFFLCSRRVRWCCYCFWFYISFFFAFMLLLVFFRVSYFAPFSNLWPYILVRCMCAYSRQTISTCVSAHRKTQNAWVQRHGKLLLSISLLKDMKLKIFRMPAFIVRRLLLLLCVRLAHCVTAGSFT